MPFTQDPDGLWRLTDAAGLFVYKARAVSVVFDQANQRVLKLGPAERMQEFFSRYMHSLPAGNYGLDFEDPRLAERTDWTVEELNQVATTGLYSKPTAAAALVRQTGMPLRVGIIGTAGRDPKRPMSRQLYVAMFRKAKEWLREIAKDRPVIAVSGGAAWSDHLAVSLMLAGEVQGLRLHLPVPFVREAVRFSESRDEGRIANYYHDLFTAALSATGLPHSSLRDLLKVFTLPTTAVASYSRSQGSSFKARNLVVAAEAERLLAFTWGDGGEPMDSGTLHTWNASKLPREHKHHISLLTMSAPSKPTPPARVEPAGEPAIEPLL